MSKTNNIHPLGDRVLVKLIEKSEENRGGILIPDAAKEKPQQAEVVALGTGKLQEDGSRSKFDVKVGDVVLVAKYGGTEVKHHDEKFTLLREEDILAIIR